MCTSVYNFYVTHCVACFLEISLGVSSKFPKHIGHKIFSRDPFGHFSNTSNFPYFPVRV